jgi:FAD/FMN-containing dehydrogenase
MFDPADKSAAEKVSRLESEGAHELYKSGAFFSRPYGPWAKFAFGEEQTIKALKHVKQIFDPNGIMNPGKLCY